MDFAKTASLSPSGSSGSYAVSDLLAMDVEAALQEIASGGAKPGPHPQSHTPTDAATLGERLPGSTAKVGMEDSVEAHPEPDQQGEPGGQESAESSDSDVIHIDLTQRPPPLPRGPGLPLEQIVTMLPGNTYAVAGSGIPMRAQAAVQPEPRQRAPTSRSGGGAPTVVTGERSPGGVSPTDSAGGSRNSPGTRASASQPDGLPSRSSGGGAKASGGGSPRMGFTFIPGLGLVPIVLDADPDDEDEDIGEDGLGAAMAGGVIIEEHSSGDTFPQGDDGDDPTVPPFDPAPLETAGGGDGHVPTAAGAVAGFTVPPFMAVAPDDLAEEALRDMLSGLAGWDVPSEMDVTSASGTVTAAVDAAFASDGSAAPSVGFGGRRSDAARMLNISEAQLQDIINQAVHGMSFEELLTDEDLADEADEGEEQEDELAPQEGQPWRIGGDMSEDMDYVEEAESAAAPAAVYLGMPPQAEAFNGLLSAFGPDAAARSDDAIQPTRLSTLFDSAAGAPSDDHDDGEAYTPDADGDSGSAGGEDDYALHSGLEGAVDDASAEDAPGGVLGAFGLSGHARAASGDSSDEEPLTTGADDKASGTASLAPLADPYSLASRPSVTSTTTANTDGAEDGSRVRVIGHPPSATAASTQLPRPRYSSPDTYWAASELDSPNPSVSYPLPAEPVPLRSTASEPISSNAVPAKRTSSLDFSASFPSPFAGGVLDMSVATGSNLAPAVEPRGSLNSTLRMSSQSLSAIRQAALHAESQRQAEFMAERLGGGANKASRAGGPASSPAHPFAAAGLADRDADGPHLTSRRSGANGSSTGYANVDAHARKQGSHGGVEHDGDHEEDGDLEDLLRDRPIIQPRYPTDAKHKPHHALHDEDDPMVGAALEHDHLPPIGMRRRSGSGNGDLQAHHKRSSTPVDLEAFAAAADGAAHPPARSLMATRKSDDGLSMPVASNSPRSYDSGSFRSSSSAHSVADERLVDELEALKEELGQKTTLVAGLRGELRKYTELAMRLEHQLSELRVQGGGVRSRSNSESGVQAHFNPLFAPASEGEHHPEHSSLPPPPARSEPARTPPGTPPPPSSSAASTPAREGVTHTPPPHPQAQGLETAARLALYGEVLSQAQMHVARFGGPAPPDLRDAQELLQGKDVLDAGTEKVMLMKLQKLVTWGCEAAFKASTAQQHVKALEQQAAHERAAWEAERQHLTQALELARAGAGASPPGSLSGAASNGASSLSGEATRSGAGSLSGAAAAASLEAEELRRQLRASQEDADAARAQVAELESAVASLSADVRKLRGDLRRSRDGSLDHLGHTSGAPAASPAAAHADSMAWSMERQMLLKTISALQLELEEARTASAATTGAEVAAEVKGSSPRAAGETRGTEAKRAALDDALLERVEQLRADRDAAAADSAALRRQLEEAVAAAAAERTDLQARLGSAGEASEVSAALYRAKINQLELELAEAREALVQREARAAEADTATQRLSDQSALASERAEAIAVRDAEIAELRQQLLAMKAGLEEAEAAVRDSTLAKQAAETELHDAREDFLAARQAATVAEAAAAAARTTFLERQELQVQQHLQRSLDVEERVLELQRLLHEGTAANEVSQQALASETEQRARLQHQLAIRTQELAQAQTQLADVQAAISQLQAEVPALQSQLSQLQGVLAAAQSDKEGAEAKAAEARAEAAEASKRAEEALTALSSAREELAEALQELEAYDREAESRDDEVERAREDAASAKERAEAAEAALEAARGESEELRAQAETLRAKVQELRSALAADSSNSEQLQEQLQQAEVELEAQKSLSQVRGERVAELEAALQEAEERYGSARAAAASAAAAAAAAADVEVALADARADVAEAQARADALAAQVSELQRQLSEAADANEQTVRAEAELRRRLAEAEQQRERAEQRLAHAEAQLETAQCAAEELQREEAVRSEGLAAMKDRLQAALADREALRRTAAELRQQLEAVAQADAVRSPQQSQSQESPGLLATRASGELRELREDKARLLSEVARLQAEVEQVAQARAVPDAPSGMVSAFESAGQRAAAAAAVADAEARAEALQKQLQTARSELQAAIVELAMKGELLAAKDKSLVTLQETVVALKVALQATQQQASSGRDDDATTGRVEQYRSSVTALQGKFEDSELTIRRLEHQVSALEQRLATEGGAARTPGSEVPRGAAGQALSPRPSGQVLSPRQSGVLDGLLSELRSQLREKDEEIGRLLEELEAARSRASSSGIGASPSPTRGYGAMADSAMASVGTVTELHTQNMQLRSLSEDLNARYLSKKEALRRLRGQLAAEQQRHADESARSQRHLEAACQRLSRLATDLGNALRRCITLDLQPLSATALTPSGNSPLKGSDTLTELNTMAALLARQGAALVESLETAVEQIAGAREERAMLSAQLAHRQAALDELRYQLSRSGLGSGEAAAGGGARGSSGGGAGAAGGGLLTGHLGASMSVPSAQHGSSTAAELRQDLAALVAQQAGVRNALHQLERSHTQTTQPKFPRSFGPGSGSYAAAAGHTTLPITRSAPSAGAGDAYAGGVSKAGGNHFLGMLAGDRSDSAHGPLQHAASVGAHALRQAHSPHRAQPVAATPGSFTYGAMPRGASGYHNAAAPVPLVAPHLPLSRARESGYPTLPMANPGGAPAGVPSSFGILR